MKPTNDIYFLPFDHRSYFEKVLFKKEKTTLNLKEKNLLKELKKVIFEGFKICIKKYGISKKNAAILVDDGFGSSILKDAKKLEVITAMPVEKSGQKVFDFITNFKKIVNKNDPDYVKALVRYNPYESKKIKEMQIKRLKILNDYLHKTKRKFLLELLVPATDNQIKKHGAKKYEAEIRPKLMLRAIHEFYENKIFPGLWKLEGVESKSMLKKIVSEIIKRDSKSRIIILGRGEDVNKVKKWLKTAAQFDEIIGFAIGRTIFMDALQKFIKRDIKKLEASELIAKKFIYFIKYWNNSRDS